MTVWLSAGMMAVAALAFVPTAGVSYAILLPAWVVIVASSVALTAAGIAAAADRMTPANSAGRGPLTIAASVGLTTLVAWSLWAAFGAGSTGTLQEAVPLLVDPIVAATVTVFLLRGPRTAVVVALLATGLTVGIVARFVSIVAPTYGG